MTVRMLLKEMESGEFESGVVSVLQGCDTASLVELFRTFRKMIAPSSSRVKVKELNFFDTPGTA
jgi:hypothetical protein